MLCGNDQQFDDHRGALDQPGQTTMSKRENDQSAARFQSILRLTPMTIASTMKSPTLPISRA